VNRAPIRDFFFFLFLKRQFGSVAKVEKFLLKKHVLHTLKHFLPKTISKKNHHRRITGLQLIFNFWVDFILFCGY
jgi:hypothetical protein